MRKARCRGTCDGDGPVRETAEGLVCSDCFAPGEIVPPPTDTYDDYYVICPHCGHRHTDPSEYFSPWDEDTTIECTGCEKTFVASRMMSITYHTQPLRSTG